MEPTVNTGMYTISIIPNNYDDGNVAEYYVALNGWFTTVLAELRGQELLWHMNVVNENDERPSLVELRQSPNPYPLIAVPADDGPLHPMVGNPEQPNILKNWFIHRVDNGNNLTNHHDRRYHIEWGTTNLVWKVVPAYHGGHSVKLVSRTRDARCLWKIVPAAGQGNARRRQPVQVDIDRRGALFWNSATSDNYYWGGRQQNNSEKHSTGASFAISGKSRASADETKLLGSTGCTDEDHRSLVTAQKGTPDDNAEKNANQPAAEVSAFTTTPKDAKTPLVTSSATPIAAGH